MVFLSASLTHEELVGLTVITRQTIKDFATHIMHLYHSVLHVATFSYYGRCINQRNATVDLLRKPQPAQHTAGPQGGLRCSLI
jgi:hypothetical protein